MSNLNCCFFLSQAIAPYYITIKHLKWLLSLLKMMKSACAFHLKMWSPSCRQKHLNTWKWQVIVLFLTKKKKNRLFSCFCVFHQFRNNSWDGYKWPRCHYMLGVSSSHPIIGWYAHSFLQGNVNPIWAEVFYTKGGCCKCPDRGPTDLLAGEPGRVSCKLYTKESNYKKGGVLW